MKLANKNDKLGYYSVNGIEFDSKIQACLYAQTVDGHIIWHFNNKLFGSYPWHIEPEKSLDALYDERAKQLRDTYDYIIVSYSGGADSQNLVESFLRQGLFIDEIIVNTMENANKKYTVLDKRFKDAKNAAAEHHFQTVPRLKEIEKRSPKTKITVLDMTDYLMSSWLEKGDASWIMDKREGLNPLNVTRFNYIHFDNVRKRFDRSKKIGLILGIEKPRTYYNDKKEFYIRFNDRATNIITIENHIKEYDNAVVEYFYWAPECCEMLAKQAHVVKRWIENNPQYQNYWRVGVLNFDIYREIHEPLLRNILYSTWNAEWWQASKATLDWYSEFDNWFIRGYKNTKQHHIWREGINYLRNNAPDFVNYEHGFADGLKVISHQYYVGQISV